MRRVLAVLPAPTFGGSANTVARLQEPLRRRGWEYVATIPDEPGNIAERLAAAGVETIAVPSHRLRATLRPGPHVTLLAHLRPDLRRLRTVIERTGAVVAHNNGDLNPHAALAGRLAGVAVHWHILDTRTPPALRRLTGPLIAATADSVSTIGRALRDTHPGALAVGDRCAIVFPPVDEPRFARARDHRAAARAELRLAPDALCVGTIGNRNPQKGQDWLVRAVARARRTDPRVVLRILGAASPGHEAYEQRLLAEAAAVGLTAADGTFGMLDPGTRVAELIGGLDALAMSSVPRSEGMPTVILEAMAAGVPVAATDVGATAELFADGEGGRIVAPCEPEALGAALLDVLGPAGPRYADVARRRLRDAFSLEHLADLFAASYEVALTHRAERGT